MNLMEWFNVRMSTEAAVLLFAFKTTTTHTMNSGKTWEASAVRYEVSVGYMCVCEYFLVDNKVETMTDVNKLTTHIV